MGSPLGFIRGSPDNANSFNGKINDWNTSNVEDMTAMFRNASRFNKSITEWNTSNVEDMSYMFEGADNFNKNLSGWNVDKVRGYDNFGLSKSKSPNWNN